MPGRARGPGSGPPSSRECADSTLLPSQTPTPPGFGQSARYQQRASEPEHFARPTPDFSDVAHSRDESSLRAIGFVGEPSPRRAIGSATDRVFADVDLLAPGTIGHARSSRWTSGDDAQEPNWAAASAAVRREARLPGRLKHSWLSLSGWGSARRKDRRRHRGSSARRFGSRTGSARAIASTRLRKRLPAR